MPIRYCEGRNTQILKDSPHEPSDLMAFIEEQGNAVQIEGIIRDEYDFDRVMDSVAEQAIMLGSKEGFFMFELQHSNY